MLRSCLLEVGGARELLRLGLAHLSSWLVVVVGIVGVALPARGQLYSVIVVVVFRSTRGRVVGGV